MSWNCWSMKMKINYNRQVFFSVPPHHNSLRWDPQAHFHKMVISDAFFSRLKLKRDFYAFAFLMVSRNSHKQNPTVSMAVITLTVNLNIAERGLFKEKVCENLTNIFIKMNFLIKKNDKKNILNFKTFFMNKPQKIPFSMRKSLFT